MRKQSLNRFIKISADMNDEKYDSKRSFFNLLNGYINKFKDSVNQAILFMTVLA